MEGGSKDDTEKMLCDSEPVKTRKKKRESEGRGFGLAKKKKIEEEEGLEEEQKKGTKKNTGSIILSPTKKKTNLSNIKYLMVFF